MTVLEFPPMLSFRSQVSMEFLNKGTSNSVRDRCASKADFHNSRNVREYLPLLLKLQQKC